MPARPVAEPVVRPALGGGGRPVTATPSQRPRPVIPTDGDPSDMGEMPAMPKPAPAPPPVEVPIEPAMDPAIDDPAPPE
jgi:hypothetical protein